MTPEFALHALADNGAVGRSYPRRVTDEETAENVIDRLLLAMAAQLDTSRDPALAAGAVEALADLSRAEADLIFGQAGLLVHYGADTEPLGTLIPEQGDTEWPPTTTTPTPRTATTSTTPPKTPCSC